MTQRETMEQAKRYMDQLAQGIDPVSGRAIPQDSVLNQIQLARCFFYISGVLSEQLAKSYSVQKPKKNYVYITREELNRVKPAQEPIKIKQFVELLNQAIEDTSRRKIQPMHITDWLLKKGFLMKQEQSEGKCGRVPTQLGRQIGIFSRERQRKHGEYQAVYYRPQAQQFLLDHMMEILKM